MKRMAFAVALVIVAAAACTKAEDRGAADTTRADSAAMDTTHQMAPDTAKMRP